MIPKIETGIRNFDAILNGGLPKGSVSIVSGPPGAGKTTFAQQICFHAAMQGKRVLFFNTLSEPTAKTLRYLRQFSFFDARVFEEKFQFVDLGGILRSKGLAQASAAILEQIKLVKPAIVVIDSFKSFDDLTHSKEELRKFGYEIAVNLMAWEITGMLLGEYAPDDILGNPLFSVVDGLITLSQRLSSGEQQRFLQVIKMRGSNHSRDEHSFTINENGLEVYAPRVMIQREPGKDVEGAPLRIQTGISKLDDLLGEGIPSGSSLLVSGVAGTGKTAACLEFIYRGALAGEKGIFFSFEETRERLLASAHGFGWDVQREIERGMIEVIFIPQPDIAIERDLLMMSEQIAEMGATRVAIDSVSVFLHKVKDAQDAREKIFQLASIVQNNAAVGFFATDIPYGSHQISRFGVEETVVDGIILLSSTEEGFERQRYIEVYKLRNTAHYKGRHSMVVGTGGIQVFPRYTEEIVEEEAPRAFDSSRLPLGVPGLDALLGGGLFKRSITLVSGSPGIGKSTLGLQFVLEGAAHNEPGLMIALEEGPEQLLVSADRLGLTLRKHVDQGHIELLYLSGELTRGAQLLSILDDKIRSRQVRRLFLDGASFLARESMAPEELRKLLFKLTASFKALDVTSVLAIESSALGFGGDVTERGFSPVADNLLMLRYFMKDGALSPALRVLKTRGSSHDRYAHEIEIGKGGLRIGNRVTDLATPPLPSGKPVRKSPRKGGGA